MCSFFIFRAKKRLDLSLLGVARILMIVACSLGIGYYIYLLVDYEGLEKEIMIVNSFNLVIIPIIVILLTSPLKKDLEELLTLGLATKNI